ncbi:MAG TPA: hypothetical protein VHI71_02530 [Actinomycetota bacterium]|nr:hypothetical protein [Actinomycetota bacterium]
MRRFATAVVIGVTALAALAGAVAAAPAPPRTQTLEYVGGGVTTGPQRSTVIRAGDNVGAVVFRGGPERFVSIEIADSHGLPVTGIVAQLNESGTHICGATAKPIRVRPYEKVTVFLMNGACGASGVSVATTGTVTATFTTEK